LPKGIKIKKIILKKLFYLKYSKC